MKKILLSLIFVLVLAADSQSLPSYLPGLIQPSSEGESVVQRNGIHREYYDNGILEKELSYKNGQLDGRCRIYYKNGNLRKQVNYQKGIIEGKAYEFYENGQYKIEGNYKNGKIDAVNKMFYKNGNLYSFMVYEDGRLIKNMRLDRKGRTITN